MTAQLKPVWKGLVTGGVLLLLRCHRLSQRNGPPSGAAPKIDPDPGCFQDHYGLT